ncbi:Rtm1p-like protein [Fusarium bulbicola]|nr:Rtm1p-like protein [Fusarium bulbicola]
MPELNKYLGKVYLWQYVPSLVGSIIFTLLFAVATGAVGCKMHKSRTRFCLPFFLGGVSEVLGYFFRALCYNATNSLPLNIMQALFLLLPPVFFAATLYMVYSRLVRALGGESCSFISVRWTTRLFVLGDILTFNIQGNGGGLLANDDLVHIGNIIVITGLIAQILLFLAFVACCVIFHRRFRVHLRHPSIPVAIRWEAYLNMLYFTSALILVRNIFRVVEFAMDKEGYLQQKEWPTFVFDSVLMLLVMLAFYVRYPDNLQVNPIDSAIELVPKDEPRAGEPGASNQMDCREARSDLDRVSRELHSLQTVLELIEEDAKDDTKPFPPTIQHHVSGIVTNCGSVVLEVETCIKKYGDGRIKSKAAWAINGQGDMEKLKSSLEAHKSALELALDMLSLSLTKDIKADTTEIRNDTAAIKDDTELILQEIAQLQARLPDTAAAPNDYILQKFLEEMATYTETTLDANVSYSDGTRSRALSIVIEYNDSSPNSPRYDLPTSELQDPTALVVSLSPDSSNPEDAAKNGRYYPTYPEPHRYAPWPRPVMEDIPLRPKGPGHASSYPNYAYDKEVALGSDPQALALDSKNGETQNQVASLPARVQEESDVSEFALLDAFDPLWRERYGNDIWTLSNDEIRENQEFVIGFLNQLKNAEMSQLDFSSMAPTIDAVYGAD